MSRRVDDILHAPPPKKDLLISPCSDAHNNSAYVILINTASIMYINTSWVWKMASSNDNESLCPGKCYAEISPSNKPLRLVTDIKMAKTSQVMCKCFSVCLISTAVTYL